MKYIPVEALDCYEIILHEEPTDNFNIRFVCHAENKDHAIEQMLDFYRGAEVVKIRRISKGKV
jgi:hypothetical protein